VGCTDKPVKVLEELANGYKQAIRKKFDGGREKDLRPERILPKC
jgi:hypothetical protein